MKKGNKLERNVSKLAILNVNPIYSDCINKEREMPTLPKGVNIYLVTIAHKTI